MSKRYEAFLAMRKHPVLGRIFNQLKVKDLVYARDFIVSHDNLTDQEFRAKAHLVGLDNFKEDKPKNIDSIWALLIQVVPPTIRRRRQ